MSMSRTSLVLVLFLLCTSCAQVIYQKTGHGEFKGDLDVRWIEPNQFIYMPSEENPLRFTTSDQRVIQPQKMYTDGGSIPQLFWGVPGLSPWGYAPAYIIHDWLFEAHHCDIPAYRDITFERSASILAEGIKTMMVANPEIESANALWAIYEAVNSPIAKSLWDKAQSCNPPVELFEKGKLPGVLLFKIRVSTPPAR
ncbi:MAG TPA: DUF1353 domain-containing protein [Rudaea sp.]|jgi:hypothetical protein|uniref:DUF1353 domain-containing protein n=1 Tax=Rudaea sp. TaxID=2136325 RepID=UPI002F92E5D8